MRPAGSLLALLALTLFAGSVSAKAKSDYVYGPPPDWVTYKTLGEAAVRKTLPATASWSVEWPNGYIATGWAHGTRVEGYMTCGTLRATTAINGRYPSYPFAIVIDRGEVKTVDYELNMRNNGARFICDALVSHGVLPPADLMAHGSVVSGQASQQQQTTIAALGLTVTAVPQGLYVATVAAQSTAAAAGLAPGMVITRANGITLAGLGNTAVTVFGTGTTPVAIETAAGGKFTLAPAAK